MDEDSFDNESKDASAAALPQTVTEPSKKSRKIRLFCFIKFCKTRFERHLNASVNFFYAPPKADRDVWKKAMSVLPNWGSEFNFERSRICELHFEEKYIVRSTKYIVDGKVYEVPCRHKLLPDAVPTIFERYEVPPMPPKPRTPRKPRSKKPKKPRPSRKKVRKSISSASVNNNENVSTPTTSTNGSSHSCSSSNSQNDVVKNVPITLQTVQQQNIPTPTTYIILPPNCTLAGPLTIVKETPDLGIQPKLISKLQISNVKPTSLTSIPRSDTPILPLPLRTVLGKPSMPRKQALPFRVSNPDNVELVELSDDFDSDSEFTPIKNDGSYKVSMPTILLNVTDIIMPSKCKRRRRTLVTASDLATLLMPTEDWSINIYKPEKTKTGKVIYTISETLLNSECVEITRKSITLTQDWGVKFTVFSHIVPRFSLFACQIEDVQKALKFFSQMKICSGFSKDESVKTGFTHTTLEKHVDLSFRSTNCCLVIRPGAHVAYYYNSAFELVCENCEFSI